VFHYKNCSIYSILATCPKRHFLGISCHHVLQDVFRTKNVNPRQACPRNRLAALALVGANLVLASFGCSTGGGPADGSSSPEMGKPAAPPLMTMPPTADSDVGTKPIHRLSNYEYDNTLRDLLGTSLRPGQRFVLEQTKHTFDNLAESLAVSARQFEDYFATARAAAAEAMSTAEGRAALGLADPAVCDQNCASALIESFGLRAFRRPLEPWEVTLLAGQYQNAIELGEDPAGAIQHVVGVMLVSPQFLYRFELDADPTSALPRPLNGYELGACA